MVLNILKLYSGLNKLGFEKESKDALALLKFSQAEYVCPRCFRETLKSGEVICSDCKGSSPGSFQYVLQNEMRNMSGGLPKIEPGSNIGLNDYSVESLMKKMNAFGDPYEATVAAKDYIYFLEGICRNWSFDTNASDVSGTVTVNVVALSKMLIGPDLPDFML